MKLPLVSLLRLGPFCSPDDAFQAVFLQNFRLRLGANTDDLGGYILFHQVFEQLVQGMVGVANTYNRSNSLFEISYVG